MTENNEELNLTPQEARELLWRTGHITEFLLDDLQKKMVKAYYDNEMGKEVIFVYARQSGKSFSYAALSTELCLQNEDFVIIYVAPTLKMGKRIVRNNMNKVLTTCPPDIKPVFKTQDSEYYFPSTRSRIILVGFNGEEYESARGNTAHLVLMDECGFMDEDKFNDGVDSALYPTLNDTRGSLMMCSTLPKSAAHPYWSRVLKARLENRTIEGTIYDCPRYNESDIAKFANRVGGFESIGFQREYLNTMITDEDKAVIPEATKERLNKIIREVNKPAFYDSYLAMDIGFRDYTAIIFGYYDFLRNTIVIEDEVIMKGSKVTTASIHTAIVAKEKELWSIKKPYLRVADNNNLILLNELGQSPYNLPIMPTAKDDREAAINKLRLIVQKEQIVINPKCTYLIQHLQHATWNSKRTQFTRDPHNGHFDALAALIYFCRNVQFQRNPYPQEYMMTSEAFYVDMSPNGFDKPKDDFQKHLTQIFNPFNKLKR